ncbi:MAG: phage gp6-like head-tail connector protein [Clostridiales bacterium]|nr:phage gp6-like head-tail connector protein [Clostridiales bacterium]
MMVSDITVPMLLDYIREDSTDTAVANQVKLMYRAAVSFVRNYTGQSAQYIDRYEEFAPVVLALVADMYDTRSYHVDNDKLNPFVQSVLDMHRCNFI